MSVIFAMSLFAFSMAITPGPNNLISLSNGVNYGFKGALPFVFGVMVGCSLLMLLTGLGLGQIAAGNDMFMKIMSFVGAGFISFLAFKIATAEPELKINDKGKPGFLHGVFFQCINPKAWIGTLAGISAFNVVGNFDGLLVFIIIYAAIVFFAVSTWAYAGSKIVRFLGNRKNHRIFNIVMGLSLFAVAVYLFFMQITEKIS